MFDKKTYIEREGKLKDGYIRAAAMTPKIKVADCEYNIENIKRLMSEAHKKDTAIAVFPEMCITGYTCNDLFLHDRLLDSALEGLVILKHFSETVKGMISFVGLPYEMNGKLYNVVAGIMNGCILGMVPKMYLPNYGEFYERRQFTPGFNECVYVDVDGEEVPFGSELLFTFDNNRKVKIGVEICEDLWTPQPPSIKHAMNGATIIVNASASNETIGKDTYRKQLVFGQSARLVCGYVYSSAGGGESTQDIVFSAHNLICENGTVLAEAHKFADESVYADIDVQRICSERRRMSTYAIDENSTYTEVQAQNLINKELELIRYFDKAPFVPSDKKERDSRCEEILNIQSYGLKKRLEHTNCKNAVIGISGGLDSTLALLVTVRAFDLCGFDRSGIHCITMPCFGTTDRTYNNAVTLVKELGCELKEVNIADAVTLHLKQLGHSIDNHDITYENAQARQRTYLLMDFANEYNGMVIGTGDMSELALGWATYNGDHMSMYGVNAGVPKTLVRHLVHYFADTCGVKKLADILFDVLDTPVSPELLPPTKNGKIAQKTEDVVGPYELHDFFLYYILRFGFEPKKVLYLAEHAFDGKYDKETILKWLKTFYRRFFSQQFKRSCLPDGPKVGSVAVSPRGDLRMPSDAVVREWLEELE